MACQGPQFPKRNKLTYQEVIAVPGERTHNRAVAVYGALIQLQDPGNDIRDAIFRLLRISLPSPRGIVVGVGADGRLLMSSTTFRVAFSMM